MNTTVPPVQVVVAYDFSPTSEAALLRAVEAACRAPHHVLHVVHAIDGDYIDAEEQHELVAARLRTAFAGRTAEHEVQFYVHVRIGKPAEQILRVAEEVGAALVFIGSHGKTGVERFVLGSVSERVVREARCTVVVARDDDYPHVDLLRVTRSDHPRVRYEPPHRYVYIDHRVLKRPIHWPIS